MMDFETTRLFNSFGNPGTTGQRCRDALDADLEILVLRVE
jgi:hypothetical protein